MATKYPEKPYYRSLLRLLAKHFPSISEARQRRIHAFWNEGQKKHLLVEHVSVMPGISTRSLRFKHAVKVAGIKDSPKVDMLETQARKSKAHPVYRCCLGKTSGTISRSCTVDVLAPTPWQHNDHRHPHDRKLCEQPAFEGQDAH